MIDPNCDKSPDGRHVLRLDEKDKFVYFKCEHCWYSVYHLDVAILANAALRLTEEEAHQAWLDIDGHHQLLHYARWWVGKIVMGEVTWPAVRRS